MAPTKAAAAVSTKTPATKKPKTHPPYSDMVKEAIVVLKERTGSSQYAIAKHIEDNHKDLPANFKKMLLVQLKKLVAAGKLTKVKNSFKLAATVKSATATEKKAPAKAKAKAPAAAKAKSAAQVKAKKVVAKAKVKTPVKGKKGVKAPVKKPKSIKSPVKKVAAKKVKK